MKFLYLFFVLLFGVVCGNQIQVQENKPKVGETQPLIEKEILWDFNNRVSEKTSIGTCYAYLSKDKKYAWLYEIEIDTEKDFTTIEIPAEIHGTEVNCIGAYYGDMANEDEYGRNLFGFIFADSGDTFEHTKEAKAQNKVKHIIIPGCVQTIKQDSFHSLEKLECIEMPKELTMLEENVFSTAPEKMIFRGNEYFTLENGILLERKNMRVRMILEGTEKVMIPEGVKQIDK